MNTNATHNDFIVSVTFDPPVFWTVTLVIVIIGIALLVRARNPRIRERD